MVNFKHEKEPLLNKIAHFPISYHNTLTERTKHVMLCKKWTMYLKNKCQIKSKTDFNLLNQ